MLIDDPWFASQELAVTVRLLLAAAAGSLVGLERETHGRPAGLRTHLLVAVASCLMMIISEGFFLKYQHIPGTSVLRIDPSRVAAQIVAGIGFIGAGVILKEGLSVRGLTTAACLWLAAGLGMGFGMGAYYPTMLTTGVGLFGLIFLKKLEPFLRKDRYLQVSIVIRDNIDLYPQFERIFASRSMHISDVACDRNLETGEQRYDFILTQHQRRMGRELTDELSKLDGVLRISYR